MQRPEVFEAEIDGIKLPLILAKPLELTLHPDPRLRAATGPVDRTRLKDESFRELIAQMVFTMYHNGGIGLAANQIGSDLSLFVFDTEWRQRKQLAPNVLINPVLIEGDTPMPSREGCLSVGADSRGTLTRFQYVEVEAVSLSGEEVRLVATDLLAACFQHEIDHLLGGLFIDYLSPLKRDMIARRKRKLKRRAERISREVVDRSDTSTGSAGRLGKLP